MVPNVRCLSFHVSSRLLSLPRSVDFAGGDSLRKRKQFSCSFAGLYNKSKSKLYAGQMVRSLPSSLVRRTTCAWAARSWECSPGKSSATCSVSSRLASHCNPLAHELVDFACDYPFPETELAVENKVRSYLLV